MKTRLRLAFSLSLATLSMGTAACLRSKVCADASNAVPSPGAPTVSGGGASSRAIAEADIVELGQSWLYALSNSGSLAIVDVSTPGSLPLLGSTMLPGQPFEMYERGTVLLIMVNGAVDAHGNPISPAAPDPTGAGGVAAQPTDPNSSAALLAVDVHDPAHVTTLHSFQVPGQVADSRIVGNVLYLVTYENGTCASCSDGASTVVTSFDVTDPASPKKVDQASFKSGAPDSYNLAWGMAWKRSIVATPTRLYLGGQAYIPDPYNAAPSDQGIIDVVDISDPAGHLGQGAHLTVAGAILNRWQMDESGGVLRVISQAGAGFTGNGTAMPTVSTYQVTSTNSITKLGGTTLTLPRQEGLRTVRFDGPRAYAITFNQTDPLFAIDLADPAAPAQRGQLSMPGWMFYLEPFGNRVIGLGVDRTDPSGSLNVSLFDVSNMDAPTMIKRVAFGAADLGEDYQILDYEVPEDQDRIQKAFRVFDDGTVAVPFSSASGGQSGCANPGSGVQLVLWASDTLTKRQLLPVRGNPRRALETFGQMLAVSDSDVVSFSLGTIATEGGGLATASADVVIGTCVPKGVTGGGMGGGVVDPWGGPGPGSCE